MNSGKTTAPKKLRGMPPGCAIDGEKYSYAIPWHAFLSNKQIADVLTYVLRKSYRMVYDILFKAIIV